MLISTARGAQSLLPTALKAWRFGRHTWAMAIGVVLAALAAVVASAGAVSAQKTFSSPQLAVAALVTAVQTDDDAELLAILGPGCEDVLYSGDPVADRNGRTRFLQAYAEQYHLVLQGDERAVLSVGSTAYPLPIPIVHQGTNWLFDTPAGREEILSRRIGRNELHAVGVVQAYSEAQREYACLPHDGGQREFAQRFASSPGKRDGLYWKTEEGEPASPFGPLLAMATEAGYQGGLDADPPEPFYGYYFRILKAQGEHAPGGAFDYVADGRMVLGFALVAYPAKYGVSGIMTFMVNQAGVIYEKDLAMNTAALAVAMTVYDPDATWRRYEEPAGP